MLKPLAQIIVLLTTTISAAHAQTAQEELQRRVVVPLHEGPNTISLLGPGHDGLVAKGHVENYNAHSYNYLAFFVTYPDSESGYPRWDLVPFISGTKTELGFSTVQGAECTLRDLRVLRPAHPPPTAITVLIADRALGASYADSGRVTFSLYELRTSAGEPGTPGIAFFRSRTFLSKRSYCDVTEAFHAELGF